MLVEWSVFALADREAIFEYIEADSPRAAIEVDDHIRSSIEGLAQFPKKGKVGRLAGTRELVVSSSPYIAAYRIADGRVRILRILHGAQAWPGELPKILR